MLLICTGSFAQSTNVSDMESAFNKFRVDNFQEKLYVHNDRSSYLVGETMWFKIYLVDGSFHKPSEISKVAYLEILDRESNPVLQTKVEMKEGLGAGSLYLPPSISTGSYTIRAYTNWMKNFSPDFYYHKDIMIINSFRNMEIATGQTESNFNAEFFPEGGNLIEGVRSKVGFQVVDEAGNGISFSGVIVDENLDTVTTFSPYRFGIGSFHITPTTQKKYTALIKDRNGKQARFALPEINESGYAMRIERLSTQLNIIVKTNISPDYSNSLYLFVHSRNRIVKASLMKMNSGEVTFDVDVKDLPDGISHFTIFDDKLNPLCERLYFKQPANQLSVTVKPNQSAYLKRNPIKVNLDVSGEIHPFNISVAVFKKDSLPYSKISIENYLMLTSDLKGTVESPEFYFEQTEESRIAADNLMLTHGWRRFKWKNVLSNENQSKEFIPEYNGQIIQGLISNQEDAPVFGAIAYISSPAKIIKTHPGRSRRDGTVYFEMQKVYGKSKIIAQLDPRVDSTSTLTILPSFSKKFADRIQPQQEVLPAWEDQLVKRSIGMQVENIYAPLPQQVVIKGIDSTAFYGMADATYLLDDFTRFPLVEEVLREYVPGVFVRKRKDGFHFLVVNRELNMTFRSSPLVLLDGVPIFDEDEIMSFDPRLIKKLEVVQKRWALGPESYFGIVSFSTYNGDLAGFELNPRSITMDYEGIQLMQEFYSPKYENKKQRESRLPDQRSLLYWNPMVVTDENGHAGLEFYASDITGEYQIVMEGINTEGKVVHSTAVFNVKDSN